MARAPLAGRKSTLLCFHITFTFFSLCLGLDDTLFVKTNVSHELIDTNKSTSFYLVLLNIASVLHNVFYFAIFLVNVALVYLPGSYPVKSLAVQFRHFGSLFVLRLGVLSIFPFYVYLINYLVILKPFKSNIKPSS